METILVLKVSVLHLHPKIKKDAEIAQLVEQFIRNE